MTDDPRTDPPPSQNDASRAEGVAVSRRRVEPSRGILSHYGIAFVTAALFVVLAISSRPFFTTMNLINVVDQQSTVLIVGAAATLIIIGGGFDLSSSAVYVTCPLVMFRIENATGNIVLSLAAALLLGAAIGLANGLVATIGKVSSFISTLASSFMIYGLGYIVSKQSILRAKGTGLRTIARTRILGIPSSGWIAVVVVLVFAMVLSFTKFGRHVYAAGGNPQAARLAGVNVTFVRTITFALGGLAAALAGAVSSARSLTAQPSDDFSLVFAVIAAVVVGGTSITGGEGAVWRTVCGAFFIAFLVNGLNLIGVDPVYQRIIQGAVILGAVLIDGRSRRRS